MEGLKTLTQVNGSEGFKGKNTPHRSNPLAHSIVCFTKINKSTKHQNVGIFHDISNSLIEIVPQN
jgi:hypothetical protein